VPFYQLAESMSTGWTAIQSKLTSSPLSTTTPVDDATGLRALAPPLDLDLDERRSLFRSTNRLVVIADVSQWYPSTYTHSFAWALEGKAATKAAIAAGRGGRSLGDRLDRGVRRSQSNQTIGMPIGPDTSFVLGELVLSQCDAALASGRSRQWLTGFRYYDDYELYVRSSGDADRAITGLESALGEYGLTVNPYKLQVVTLPHPLEAEWVSALKRIQLRNNAGQERTDLTLLFDEAFRLRLRYPDEHVVAYALGRFVDRYGQEGHRVKRQNWPHLERLLLQASLSEPGVLQKAVHIVYWAKERGWPLNKRALSDFLTVLAAAEAARGHSSEVAWALWSAILLEVRIKAEAARLISKLTDDVVALCALHARDLGVIGPGLEVKSWESLMNADELWGQHWLLAYEAYEHGWLPAPVDYIGADPAFAHLRAHAVRFYDVTKDLPPAAPRSTTVTLTPPREFAQAPTEPAIRVGY
jgi:hypothetical protein